MNSTKREMDKDIPFSVPCKAIKKTEKIVKKNDKEINFLKEFFYYLPAYYFPNKNILMIFNCFITSY